ncbi:MAG: two-component regulator propeller domain-containing protein [Candidatus Zixiibacteriota bacterium]
MTQIRLSIIVLSVCIVLPSACFASMNDVDMITYADFTRVNYIATSISHVYFATTEGIIRYDKSMRQWNDPLTGAEGVDNRDIQRIWCDVFNEKLYIQTSTGYLEYDILFEQWYPISELPSLNVNYAHVRPPSVMFAPPGLNYAAEGYVSDIHGRDFRFNDIVDDRAGNLWIGTWGYGPAVADAATDNIELLTFGLIQNRVDAVYDDDGVLWIGGSTLGSFRTGMTVFDTEENSFEHIETGWEIGLPAVDVNCIDGDDDFVYVGTEDGLFVYDRDDRRVARSLSGRSGLPDDYVHSVCVVGDSIFVGTASGLAMLTFKADSVTYVQPGQFSNADIYDFETTDSSIWIASSSGAFQLHYGSGRLQKLMDPHNVLFGRVFKIERYETSLWLASDGGMVRLDLQTGETTPFVSISSGSRGRPLAVNDRIAALATERGVTLYFLDREDHIYEREFTNADGLPSYWVNCLLLDGDYLWIGTDRGLTRFLWNDPDRLD